MATPKNSQRPQTSKQPVKQQPKTPQKPQTQAKPKPKVKIKSSYDDYTGIATDSVFTNGKLTEIRQRDETGSEKIYDIVNGKKKFRSWDTSTMRGSGRRYQLGGQFAKALPAIAPLIPLNAFRPTVPQRFMPQAPQGSYFSPYQLPEITVTPEDNRVYYGGMLPEVTVRPDDGPIYDAGNLPTSYVRADKYGNTYTNVAPAFPYYSTSVEDRKAVWDTTEDIYNRNKVRWGVNHNLHKDIDGNIIE